jgi:hypothetical protein
VKNGEHQFSAKKIKKEENSGYHSIKYMQVDGKTCFFEIIINYYFHIVLLEASVCMKRTPMASTKG